MAGPVCPVCLVDAFTSSWSIALEFRYLLVSMSASFGEPQEGTKGGDSPFSKSSRRSTKGQQQIARWWAQCQTFRVLSARFPTSPTSFTRKSSSASPVSPRRSTAALLRCGCDSPRYVERRKQVLIGCMRSCATALELLYLSNANVDVGGVVAWAAAQTAASLRGRGAQRPRQIR